MICRREVLGILFAAGAGRAAAAPALRDAPVADRMTTQFAMRAAMGSIFAIRAYEIAIDRRPPQSFVRFATYAIYRRRQMLRNLAASTQVIIPRRLNLTYLRMMDQLQVSGSGFADTFTDIMGKHHDTEIALFEHYEKDGSDNSVKNFATSSLPFIKEQQRRLRQLDVTR